MRWLVLLLIFIAFFFFLSSGPQPLNTERYTPRNLETGLESEKTFNELQEKYQAQADDFLSTLLSPALDNEREEEHETLILGIKDRAEKGISKIKSFFRKIQGE